MNWFIGRFEHSLDEKGRVILPKKFRDIFRSESYISHHEDGCLALWTDIEFNEQAAKFREMGNSESKNDRNKARFWAANVQEVKVDAQGRIAIPSYLREFAGLESEVIVNGNMNRIEFWSPTRWASVEDQPLDES
ncbi:MAG: division/cell wall cluster transcriptional repressor MraZ [Acidimicrobiales bacterium]|nr:division/cell wall cluster transcriptional repressor MraZ [Acidimicrobiales bacterium]